MENNKNSKFEQCIIYNSAILDNEAYFNNLFQSQKNNSIEDKGYLINLKKKEVWSLKKEKKFYNFYKNYLSKIKKKKKINLY